MACLCVRSDVLGFWHCSTLYGQPDLAGYDSLLWDREFTSVITFKIIEQEKKVERKQR